MEQQVILGIVVVILALGMVIMAMLRKPFGNYVDYIIAVIGVLLVLLSLAKINCRESIEGFSQMERIFQILDIKNSGSSGSAIASGALTTSGNGNSNEDLTKFIRNLTLYYSAFSTSSYPTSTRRWLNISPFFVSPQTVCPDVSMEDTNCIFTEVPSFSRENGFGLGVNKIVGPQSHQLGISANDAFTIFFTIGFDDFPDKTNMKAPLEIIHLYANTISNTGIVFAVNHNYSVNNELVTAELLFSIGDVQHKIPNFTINQNYIYFFTITKIGSHILLKAYPNIGEISSTSSFNILLSDIKVDTTKDIMLSNKEMVLNANQNVPGHIFNLGFYNKSIPDSMINDLYMNIQTEIQKNNELLQQFAGTITNLQTQLSNTKACPYGSSVCSACVGVTDWTSMTNVILNANTDCLAAINKYCTTNHSQDLCACWNPSSVLSQTNQCKSYTGIFQGGKCVTTDSIDSESLATIKQKYNLISATECPAASSAVAGMPVKPIVVPAPKVIDNLYNINATDVDLYNKLNSSSMTASKNSGTLAPAPTDNTSWTASLTSWFK